MEKTYQITGKSKRGKLANVQQLDGGNYELVYLTKAKSKKILFQRYVFDNDFNFLNLEDGEIALDKVKTKFSWFKFNGNLYSVDGITLNWNPAMPLKLKKKRTTYKYDWLLLGYHKTVDVLEKVKPRDEDGLKYFAKKYFEDEITGDIYIVVGAAKGLVSKDSGKQFTDMRILKFDWNLNKTAEVKIPFEFAQEVAFGQGFGQKDPNNSEAIGILGGTLVFSPVNMKGVDAPKDKDKGNFTYVEFDSELNIIAKESFNSPSPGWAIEGASFVENSEGGKDVYVYGPSAFGKDKYHNMAVMSTKYKSFQLMKVSSGKVQYVSETVLEDFMTNKKMSPSSKKTLDYKGKNKPAFNFLSLSNDNILLYGQFSKEGVADDYMGLQFDKNGKLVANYMRNKQSKFKVKHTCPQLVFENNTGLFWESFEYTGTAEANYNYPTITKINVNQKTMSDPLVLGKVGNKLTYFSDRSFPKLSLSTNESVYFGSDRRGKTIWFCRVKMN